MPTQISRCLTSILSGITGVEVIDNPFDFGKKVITGLNNRGRKKKF